MQSSLQIPVTSSQPSVRIFCGVWLAVAIQKKCYVV